MLGDRTVNAAEAAIVRGIFSRYAAGEAPQDRRPCPARRRLERAAQPSAALSCCRVCLADALDEFGRHNADQTVING
jgi:hypothetical protein